MADDVKGGEGGIVDAVTVAEGRFAPVPESIDIGMPIHVGDEFESLVINTVAVEAFL